MTAVRLAKRGGGTVDFQHPVDGPDQVGTDEATYPLNVTLHTKTGDKIPVEVVSGEVTVGEILNIVAVRHAPPYVSLL